MLRATCTVAVTRPVAVARDALGIAVYSEPAVDYVDVLVDAIESAEAQRVGTLDERRPRGVLHLHFPKTYHESLHGCSVELPEPWEGTWEVVGDPMPYDAALTPGVWDRKVMVQRADV